MHAPIALFAYNRPKHLEQVINALLKNKESRSSDLVVYSDAPRTIEDGTRVAEVRRLLDALDGFRSIRIIKREVNHGLAKSIIGGVSDTLKDYDGVIVLEDDVVPSPHFLDYMNEALRLYKNEETVGCIHAYSYPCPKPLPKTFFLKGADCWGWGTWKNSWNLFEKNGQVLLDKILDSNLSHQFDLEGAVPYTQMLRNQIHGKNDSWAIRWHASMFLANKLCLHPGKSLVKNIGLDATGTNCLDTDGFDVKLAEEPISFVNHFIEESTLARNTIKDFFIKNKLLQ